MLQGIPAALDRGFIGSLGSAHELNVTLAGPCRSHVGSLQMPAGARGQPWEPCRSAIGPMRNFAWGQQKPCATLQEVYKILAGVCRGLKKDFLSQ